MDLSGTIESFASSYTVSRYNAPTVVAGIYSTPTVASTFSVRGVAQPLTGRELQVLPEGLRNRELLNFWTATELRTVNGLVPPDTISINGETWQVQKAERWAELGNYWKAVVARADP